MATDTIRTLTDQLIQEKQKLTLNEYINQHLANGGDLTSLRYNIWLVTTNEYDYRTIRSWVSKAEKGI